MRACDTLRHSVNVQRILFLVHFLRLRAAQIPSYDSVISDHPLAGRIEQRQKSLPKHTLLLVSKNGPEMIPICRSVCVRIWVRVRVAIILNFFCIHYIVPMTAAPGCTRIGDPGPSSAHKSRALQ